MRKAIYLSVCGLFILTTMFISSCKKDSTPAKPAITFSSDSVKLTSGDTAKVTINISSPAGLSKLEITKYLNNEIALGYGVQGVVTITTSDKPVTYQYSFSYKTDTTDVDQLIYFTVKATDASNQTQSQDITVAVKLSPRDNLTRKAWKTSNVIRVLTGDDITEAYDIDNVMTLNSDGTWSMNWGTSLTAWGLEAYQVCQTYTVTSDNKYFIRRYSNGLGNDHVVDTLDIKMFTVNEIDLQQNHIDMTYFNSVPPVPTVLWTTDESFNYKWKAQPRK